MTTTSSSVIRSAVVKSSLDAIISVRRTSPNCALTSKISSQITFIKRSGEPKISKRSTITANKPSYSFKILSCSKAVKRCKRKSRMACACSGDSRYPSSVKPYCCGKSSTRQISSPTFSNMLFTKPGCQAHAINFSFATCGEFACLISVIISSILANAMPSPSRTCARLRAFFNSKIQRRVTTSRRCFRKYSNICLRFKVLGCLSTNATMLIPNTTCICVCAYRLFRITSAISPRFNSMTTRIPCRSDSSRRPEMPSIFLSRTNSAIFSTKRALFT